MTGQAIFEHIQYIDEDLILEALPASWQSSGKAISRRKGSLGRFLSSPVAAVILSVVVSGAVLTGIILAGQSGPGTPPVGTNAATETEATAAPPTDSESATEPETEPETVTGPEVTESPNPSPQIPADRECRVDLKILANGYGPGTVNYAHVYKGSLSQKEETIEINEEPMDVLLLRAYERAGKLSTVVTNQPERIYKNPESDWTGSSFYVAVQAVYDMNYQPLDVDLNSGGRYLGKDILPTGIYYIILEYRVELNRGSLNQGAIFTINGETYTSDALTMNVPYRLIVWPKDTVLPAEVFPDELYKGDIPSENMREPQMIMNTDSYELNINDTGTRIDYSYLYLADYSDGTYNYGVSGKPMDADMLRACDEAGLISALHVDDSAITRFTLSYESNAASISRMELTAIYDADFQQISGEPTDDTDEIMTRLSELPDGTYYVILDLAHRSTGKLFINIGGEDYYNIYNRRSIPLRLVIGETDETFVTEPETTADP